MRPNDEAEEPSCPLYPLDRCRGRRRSLGRRVIQKLKTDAEIDVVLSDGTGAKARGLGKGATGRSANVDQRGD